MKLDKEGMERLHKYRNDAISDGWAAKQTYSHEPIESHSTLRKDGFVMMIMSRSESEDFPDHGDVTIWCPDGMQVDPPETYSWDEITASTRKCLTCKSCWLCWPSLC